MVRIADLKEGDVRVSLRAIVLAVSKTRQANTQFGQKDVATALLSDGSAKIFLNLWGDQIYVVDPGMKIEITRGYVRKWKGRLNVSIGSGGEIKVIHRFFIDRKKPEPEVPASLTKAERERMDTAMKDYMDSVSKNYKLIQDYETSAKELRKRIGA